MFIVDIFVDVYYRCFVDEHQISWKQEPRYSHKYWPLFQYIFYLKHLFGLFVYFFL